MSDHQPQSSKPVEDGPIDWEYDCAYCSRGFDASMAHQIEVVSDAEAKLMCPWCKYTATYERPEVVERPPAIVTTSVKTTEAHQRKTTTARVFFEGGAWLQFHENGYGQVVEEMFNPNGKRIESFNTEFEYDDTERDELYDDAEEYPQRVVDLYEKYTIRGLRIQMPHVAAVLLDGH